MNKILTLIMLITCIILISGRQEQQIYYFCAQPGTVNGEKVFVMTDVHVHMDNRNCDQEQAIFADLAKRTVKDWSPQFDPHCVRNGHLNKLDKILQKTIKRAKDQNFGIMQLKLNKEKSNGTTVR